MARYYAGAEGRCYLYDSEATTRCEWNPYDDERADEIRARLEQAPLIFGFDAIRMLRRAHRSSGGHPDPDNPKLCADCGMPLVKVGYRTWTEAPTEQVDVNEATKRLHSAFGFSHVIVPGSVRYWPLKREAIQHSREQADIDRASAREEARA